MLVKPQIVMSTSPTVTLSPCPRRIRADHRDNVELLTLFVLYQIDTQLALDTERAFWSVYDLMLLMVVFENIPNVSR